MMTSCLGAWGVTGTTPILPLYFEESSRTTFTVIGTANVDGFVMSACEVAKRDQSDNRGTVNTESFEHFL